MSVRCDGEFHQQRQPYFVTFDLAANHFVYENTGGNLLPGEIIATNDERLELSLKATGGRILLSFDRKGHSITWPGMPAGELGRPLLTHNCTAVTGRTVLSSFYQSEPFDPKRRDPVDAFSLTCPGKTDGNYFVTLDRATKSVVLETEHASGSLSGNIASIDDGVIRFAVGRGASYQFDLLWDERKRLLTWIGVPDNPGRPTTVHECIVTKPRSIIEVYPGLSRWR